MWLFTPHGFYSAVEHRNQPDTIIVRARDADDLEALRSYIPDLEVVETTNADYRYRAFVSRSEWASAVSTMSRQIDYDNFKNAVKKRQGEHRASVYMRVWSAMLALQPALFGDRAFLDDSYYHDEYALEYEDDEDGLEPRRNWRDWRRGLGL